MIARSSAIVVANNVLGAAQGFLALFVVARYMGDEILGARAFAIALVGIAGLVARLGLPTTHVRRLARGEDVAASNGTFAALKLILVVVAAVLTILGGWLWTEALGQPVRGTTPVALYLAFGVILVQAVRDVPVHSFQGLRMFVEREAVLFCNTVGTVLLTIWAGLAYAASHGRWLPAPGIGEWAAASLGVTGPLAGDAGLHLLMTAVLVAECASLGLALTLFVLRRIPLGRPGRLHMVEYLRFTVPLMLLTLGEVTTKWIGQAAVGLFHDARVAGHYAAAAKLSEIFLLVPLSLVVVLLPTVSHAHRHGQDEAAHRVTRTMERVVGLVGWPILAVLTLQSAAVLHILVADAFLPAANVLAILSWQTFTAGLVLGVQTLAVGLGQPGRASRIVLVSVAVTVLLNLLLVPHSLLGIPLAGLGAEGAAWASLTGTLVAAALYALPATHWKGHSILGPYLARHAVAAAAAFATSWLLPQPERFIGLAANAAGVLAVYLVVAWFAGAIRKDDWQLLRRLGRDV